MTNTYTTDSTLNPDAFRFEPGTFAPDPRRAPVSRMLASQAKIEATLFLRHGEQLLLSFIIPLGMLIVIAILPVINDPHPLHKGFPLMLSIAAMSSGFTGQAISLAFDRRYGALKRTGASGVPTWTIIVGKILGVVTVSILQILVLGTTALLLGWTTTFGGALFCIAVFFLGVAAFTSLGMAMGGTLSSELVLGLANLIWVALIGSASFLLFRPPADPSWLYQLIPSISLSDGLLYASEGTFPGLQLLILAGWLLAGVGIATKWFKFT